MTSKERIDTAVALEVPDRVPVGPLLDHFAATHTGLSNADLMEDTEKRIEAVLRTMRELGPWDLTFAADTARAVFLKLGIPARIRFPGRELPPNELHQVEEREILTPEDYDRIVRVGAEEFAGEIVSRLYPEIQLADVPGIAQGAIADFAGDRERIEGAGAVMAVGGYVTVPFEYFSYARSLGAFCLDLYDRPEKVKAAFAAFGEWSIGQGLSMAEVVGVPRVFLGLGRAGPALMSPAHWEEFVWPSLEQVVHEVAARGMTTVLHADTSWTTALPRLRRLPSRTCILEVDGTTDIWKAKEVLGDHMCLMGDVPGTLLAFGTKDEVMAYCRRLVTEVGRGGGFILSSGCSIPANAKVENVKALFEAAEEWGRA